MGPNGLRKPAPVSRLTPGSHLRYQAQAAPGVALIEIDRPQAHNALDRADQYHFDDLLAAAVADPGVRCLVLAGAGGKALSAGGTSRRCRA